MWTEQTEGTHTGAAVADTCARVREIFAMAGPAAAALRIPQIALILGEDAAVVAANLRADSVFVYDEKEQTVSLREPEPRSKAAAAHRRSMSERDEEDGSTDEEGEKARQYTPHTRGEKIRQAQPPPPHHSNNNSSSISNPKGRTVIKSSSSALPPSRYGDNNENKDSVGRYDFVDKQLWQASRQSPPRGMRRRKVPGSRMGSLNPPLHSYPPALGLTRVGSGADSRATSHQQQQAGTDMTATTITTTTALGAPLLSLLAGRVGYVCVAEEFLLGEMQTHYANLGYFTKFDLGVLHVRLPEKTKEFPKAAAEGSPPSQQQQQGNSPATEEECGSPATSTYIRQRKSNFDLFIFEYGAVVWWGSDQRFFKLVESDFLLPDSSASRFMVNRYPTQLVNENYPVWCSYSLVRKESLDVDDDFRQKLRFDHFLIPFGRQGEDAALCGTTMLCCSHALAQSAKIDYLELKVQELTEACAPLPRQLRQKGHANITERRLLQLRGELLSYRLMLNSESDLLDEPDFFWENAYLKPIFEATKDSFDVDDRVEALGNKLDASNEILAMLAEEFSQRHGARLEWIVIWLVFVEVIIGVLELAVDVRPWFHRS